MFASPQANRLRWRARTQKEVSLYESVNLSNIDQQDNNIADKNHQGLTWYYYYIKSLFLYRNSNTVTTTQISSNNDNTVVPQRSLLHLSIALNAILLGLYNLSVHASWIFTFHATLLVIGAALTSWQRRVAEKNKVWRHQVSYSKRHIHKLLRTQEEWRQQQTRLLINQEQLYNVQTDWNQRFKRDSNVSAAQVRVFLQQYNEQATLMQKHLQYRVHRLLLLSISQYKAENQKNDYIRQHSGSDNDYSSPDNNNSDLYLLLDRFLSHVKQLNGVMVHEQNWRNIWSIPANNTHHHDFAKENNDTLLAKTMMRSLKQLQYDSQHFDYKRSLVQYFPKQQLTNKSSRNSNNQHAYDDDNGTTENDRAASNIPFIKPDQYKQGQTLSDINSQAYGLYAC